MSQSNKIAKNAGILMGMQLIVRVLDAVTAIILARYLSPDGFGLFSFVISFVWLFGMLPGFGMGAMTTRNIARAPEETSKYVCNGLVVKTFLATTTMILIMVAAHFCGYSSEKQFFILIAGFLMIFDTNIRFGLSFFQAYQKMVTLSLTNILVPLGWILGSLGVILFRGGVFELLLVRMIISGLGLLVVFIMVDRRLQKVRWNFDFKFCINMLKNSFPFAMFRLYGQVYRDVDTVMLSSLSTDAMTGLYSAAAKFVRLFKFIPRSLFGAMLPALASSSKEDMIKSSQKSIRYLLLIVFPLSGGITMIASDLVFFLLGSDYMAAVSSVQVLSWSLIFAFLNGPLTATIAAVNKEKEFSQFLILGLLFSGLANLIVIPLYGHLGAAVTTLMAEAGIMLYQVHILRKEAPGLRVFAGSFKIILALFVMMGALYFVQKYGMFLMIPVGTIVYLGALILLRAVDKEDWEIFKKILKKLKKKKKV